MVEDDADIAGVLRRSLDKEGYEVRVAGDGPAALSESGLFEPDAVVLDLGLPRLDGVEVCRQLREDGDVPILILTARDAVDSRVEGLDSGADDYLVKPFAMSELVARVRAAARRTSPPAARAADAFAVEELRIDPQVVQAFVDGRSANLTPTEFRLLHALALEHGRVVTRDELLQRLWGRRQSYRDRTVDVFVRKLRDKIDRRASAHTFIQTRFGVGYRFHPEPKPHDQPS